MASTLHNIQLRDDSQKHHIRRLPVLILHTHSRCNCRCVMCDIWKNTAARELTLEYVVELLPQFEELGVKTVVFSGGEPLMNRQLPEIAQRLRRSHIRLILLSSGLLLERYAQEISEYLDEVIVSLDGPPAIHDAIRRVPGAYDALARGVRSIKALNASIPIASRMTVQQANRASLRATVTCARELGLRSISFLAVDTGSEAFNRELVWPLARQMEVGLSLSDVQELAQEVEALIAECNRDIQEQFILESPAKLRRLIRHFRAQAGLEEPVAPACNAPWNSAVLELDGTVRPCFFQPAIGNMVQGTLQGVINGESAVQFRRTLNIAANPICRNCVCSLNYRDPELPDGPDAHSPV